MFINDINIFWYVGIGILGFLVGNFLGVVNYCLPEHKKVFSMDMIKNYIHMTKSNYILNIITCVLYLVILYFVGISDWVRLAEYLILSPMLVSAFAIDYKLQIIPNRLTLTMWEAGIIFSFIRGINNLNAAVEMWIGMVLGAGIFFLLTFLGNIIFKKETMGFGDVKLMGALRPIFRMEKCIGSYYIIIFHSCNLQYSNDYCKKDKKRKNGRVYSFWTIHSNSKFYCYVCSI